MQFRIEFFFRNGNKAKKIFGFFFSYSQSIEVTEKMSNKKKNKKQAKTKNKRQTVNCSNSYTQ